MSDYVTMPQNDSKQIEQVLKEYEQDPSKGLAHGVQKDAIQNGFGARITKSERKACTGEWKFFFELIKIKGKDALVFWDEGTKGLTGDILSCDDIEKRSASGLLGAKNANQNLSRFLTRFESGGNFGPGTFGRGKLIFQAASNIKSILIDSLRSDDNQYISLDRKVIGNQLKQPRIPYTGTDAIDFIKNETDGILNPLKKSGTRVTILDVNSEIIDTFSDSFIESDSIRVANDFYHMIEETWWEILKMGAEIYLRFAGKEIQVEFTSPLAQLLNAQNEKNGYRVFEEKNIPVVIKQTYYHIKELKLIVAPEVIDEEFQEIWVQRKRMKIGSISKRINPHHKIQKKLTGFIRLEPELESLFENSEGVTHYGFDLRGSGVGEVRDVLRTKLEEFQHILGIRTENIAGKIHNELNDALKDLNHLARDLGIPTDFSQGIANKEVSLSLLKFELPDENSKRIELGDEIGPLFFKIENVGVNAILTDLVITFEQGNQIKQVFSKKIELSIGQKINVITEKILVDSKDFTTGAMLLVKAKLKKEFGDSIYDSISRELWVGMDPPNARNDLITFNPYPPKFPRKDTRRVEKGEVLENLGFKISNNENMDFLLNIDVVVRKSKTQMEDVKILKTLFSEKGYLLPSMADVEIPLGNLMITPADFDVVFNEQANQDSRKCELFFSVRFAEAYTAFGKIKGEQATAKKSILFFCGVDPTGMSIFKAVEEWNEPSDGLRSDVKGDRLSGYTFSLNTGHSAYKFFEGLDADVREFYYQEQMLFQAFNIAISNNVFDGVASAFKEDLTASDLAPEEASRKIYEIVGRALNQLRR